MEMVPDNVEKIDPLADSGEWKRAMLEELRRLVAIEQERNEREKMRPDLGRLLRTLASAFVGEYDKFTKR